MIRVVRASVDDAATVSGSLASLYHRQTADVDRMERMLSESDQECVGYLHAQLINRLDGALMLPVYDTTVARDRRREGVGIRLMETALGRGTELGAARC